MAPRQTPYSYSQPFSQRAALPHFSQTLAPTNPYIESTFGHRSIHVPKRPPVAGAGFSYPINMPNYSTLPSNDLYNLLVQPADEQEQQHRFFALPIQSQESQALLKRPHPAGDTFEELSDEADHNYPNRHKQVMPARDKKSKKQQTRRLAASTEPDDEYFEDAEMKGLRSSSPVHRPRRSARSKKSPATTDFLTPDPEDSFTPQTEQKTKHAATTKRAKKARPGRLIRKKPIGVAVPKTLAEAGPADRMMWEWKNQGRNWEEIRAEWKKMTGVEPGGSSLSVRYIKLVENLARNGAAGDIELLRFKKEAEEELMSQLWPKVAEKMLAYNAESEHNPKDLQKRYNMIVRSGYDVEKLLAEDTLKHESEQKQRPFGIRHTQCEDNFTIDPEFAGQYDNPTANATAASIRLQDRMGLQRPSSHLGYPGELPELSLNSNDIFEQMDILQARVDGLNDQPQLEDTKVHDSIRHKMDCLVSSNVPQSNKPLMVQQNIQTDMNGARLPIQRPLVDYVSDSE